METNKELNPTEQMAKSFKDITEYLNAHLFDGQLPPVFITLTRNNKVTGGYFASDQWTNNDTSEQVAEIGINSNLLADGDPLTFYNVLLHELIHLEQYETKTNGRKGYHNQAFADRCDAMGFDIKVSDKDAVEGQKTGQAVATYLRPGGKAELIIANCPYDLDYSNSQALTIDDAGQPQAIPEQEPKQEEPKKSGVRVKYTCPKCGTRLWGKSGLDIICSPCYEHFIEAR